MTLMPSLFLACWPVTVVLFASDRLRPDMVAHWVILALILVGP